MPRTPQCDTAPAHPSSSVVAASSPLSSFTDNPRPANKELASIARDSSSGDDSEVDEPEKLSAVGLFTLTLALGGAQFVSSIQAACVLFLCSFP